MRPHWIPNRFVCMCVGCSRWAETGISSMRDHARASQPARKMKRSRPVWVVVVVVVGSQRGGVFHSKGDTTYRTAALVFYCSRRCIGSINVFRLFFLLFIIRKGRVFFSPIHYQSLPLEFCGCFFHQFCVWMTIMHLVNATNQTTIIWLVIFFVVGLTPSDRFVITFLSSKFFHNRWVAFPW
jgi:hypothetical protein